MSKSELWVRGERQTYTQQTHQYRDLAWPRGGRVKIVLLYELRSSQNNVKKIYFGDLVVYLD